MLGWLRDLQQLFLKDATTTIASLGVVAVASLLYYISKLHDRWANRFDALTKEHNARIDVLNRERFQLAHEMRQELLALAKQLYQAPPPRRRQRKEPAPLKAGGAGD